jgi:predicted nucleotidyltransferase
MGMNKNNKKHRIFVQMETMNSDISNIIINTLREYNPEMIGIFGSYARNKNTGNSDIDILVRFKSTLSLLQIIHIENLISQKLGIKVDLVTEGAIRNKTLRETIKKDLQIIYQ